MVSNRCKILVRDELDKLGLHHLKVELGEVEIFEDITPTQREILKTELLVSGLELMEDKKAILIEKIQKVIIEMLYREEGMPKINNSDYIGEKLGHDYNYLSNLFSEVKGTTIEHFIIVNKIERVKELLLYDDLTLTEISYRLNYSSVAHLSSQFKKVTGLTPSYFKQFKNIRN